VTLGPGLNLTLLAWVWVMRVEWRRRRLPFGDLVAWLESVPSRAASTVPHEAVFAAIRRAYVLSPFRPTCLRESLAALGLLRSLGFPARLAIGVKVAEAPVDAHAWVELNGVALGPPADDYRPLRRRPAG